MLDLEITNQFKHDLKKINKQQKNNQLIDALIVQLQHEQTLHPKHRDHGLTGDWNGYRECHITPDWLLIYKIIKDDCVRLLRLARTGSHSDLFK